ncbi:GTPase HflX [Euzebya tangerina]|uniref:GTPase HflX n=1 Tax=Euzebya tangerina TaxID=591198 RepID=UPI0013C2C6E8|nr:GTPase HflX [Euzebya tangerina]
MNEHHGPDGASDLDEDASLVLTRAQRRRSEAERIEEGAPQEGVDIFRPVDNAVLVALALPGTSSHEVEASMDEMEQLLETAGGATVGRIVQRRHAPDVATFIGRGKVSELKDLVQALDADAAVFDDDLSPAQQRNLEEKLGVKVLDRTIVILDIFAQHASSSEGTAQVELAQLTYLLPRLRGWGAALSRQAGGIGSRGPGESQLEVDRRKLNRRITKLRRDLKDFAKVRQTKSKWRRQNQVPTVALVGYTNAGKSTLMNAMTDAGVLVADQLFATLDTTARQLELPDSRQVVLTDTVGFVRKLPTALVESFKSTLEDTLQADLLLHVVDAAHPEAQAHVMAVDDVLAEIGAGELLRLIVLNKADLADPDDLHDLASAVESRAMPGGVIVVSAATGEGVDELIDLVADRVPPRRRIVEGLVPYASADVVAGAYEGGEVLKREDRQEGTWVSVSITRRNAQDLLRFADVDPWADEEA